MSIIISKKGQKTQKLDKSDFEKEDYLQNYIHQNPESIPVYEIEKDKKLFVVKREFPTNSGPIDALAVDKDGDIYIVETKLYKNPDKRTVVAQALDYGSALWRHLNDFNDFVSMLDQECQMNFQMNFKEKLGEFFKLDESQIEIQMDSMRKNLNEGNLKFVILMDAMEERLKDLIVYVNQNSQFDIYAVQLEYYQFNDYEIMIPKIFGVEVKKNIKGGVSSNRKSWNKDSFLEEAKRINSAEIFKLIKDFLDFSYRTASKVSYGTGNEGIFRYVIKVDKGESTPFFVTSEGLMKFNLDWLLEQGKADEKAVLEFIDNLKLIEDINFKDGKSIVDLKELVYRGEVIEKIKKEIKRFTKKLIK
jgi:hypothetical protein